MSTALTATLPRAVIELAGDAVAPPRPPSPHPPAFSPPPPFPPPLPRQPRPPGQASGSRRIASGAAGEKPPAKRRRGDDGPSPRKSLKACLQEQVLPLVISVVDDLAPASFRVDDLAVHAVTALARSPTFRIKIDEAAGASLPLGQGEAARLAADVVKRLAALPQYQIRPRRPPDARQDTARRPQPTPWAPSSGAGAQRAPWRGSSKRVSAGDAERASTWLRLKQRPYLAAAERDSIAQGAKHAVPGRYGAVEWPVVYHVDFTADEVAQVFSHLTRYLLDAAPRTPQRLAALCYQHNVASMVGDGIRGRSAEDVRNFCSDLMAGRAALDRQRVLSLDRDSDEAGHRRRQARQASRIPSLLLARELYGNAGFGRTRQLENFQNECKKAFEDGLAVAAEFTNCAGDITTMSWVPDGNVLCGTTAHSDAHNQQYNKPGNLLLCSTSRGTLRAFADHRMPRPRVDRGDNASEAMRQSQDPWLYASVVSSDYDAAHGLAFTSSFDKTVKVWAVARGGEAMEAVATWHHGGNVNFVAAARDGSGRVASAADVPAQAVRVYTVDPADVAASPYRAFSCSRTDADDSRTWAYFPATMQWGRAPGTAHLLLVGYSPRSLTADDRDIPEDRRNSGEILLWDAARGCRVPVLTATTANAFEVAWHPRLQRFIVATSPCGLNVEHGVGTQIHVFQRDRDRDDGAYSEFQKLDCPAVDINELTIMPNSPAHAYVTAGCTDGCVYVWDTAEGDDPVHVLRHGDPLADCAYDRAHDRERDDTGVKLTAWGASPDRLYTGSSDGVVKLWNVRSRRSPFVRNLLEAPGPISCGAFSPDRSQLAVGDATGRVFLLSVDGRNAHDAHDAPRATLPGSARRVRRPRPFMPHPEPPPPPPDPAADLSIAAYARRTYLDSGQLILHRNPVVGAVQGPRYAASGLFRADAHLDDDPAGPLLTEYERHQRESQHASRAPRLRRSERRLRDPFADDAAAPDRVRARADRHAANRRLDLDALRWDFEDLWNLLVQDGAVLTDADEDWGFAYEEMPATLDEGEE